MVIKKWRNMLYSFASKLKFTFRFPFLTYAWTTFYVNGFETQEILDLVEPGDILCRGYFGYLNNIVLNGTQFTHVGLVVDKKHVIHAIAPHAIKDSIIHFCRCDYIAVIRPLVNFEEKDRKLIIENAISRAHNCIGIPYDFDFKFEDGADGNLSCTELVSRCYNNLAIIIGMKVEKFRIFPIPFLFKEREVIQPDAPIKYGNNNKIIYQSKYAESKIKKILKK